MAGRASNQHPRLVFTLVFKSLGYRVIKPLVACFAANLQTQRLFFCFFPEILGVFRERILCITIAEPVIVLNELGPVAFELSVERAKCQCLVGDRIPLCRNLDLECLAIIERGEALTQPARTGKQVDDGDGG
ncbi:hypothetical protein D3C80_1199900 [compost metagenome]